MNDGQGSRRIGDNGNDGAGTMLTMREACRLLNVHGNTLRRWSSMGLVTAYRIGAGRQRRFRAEDIESLVVEQVRFVSGDDGKYREADGGDRN
jgi:excisionase family DNA binding protein